ncbi:MULTISPECIES: TIGR03960 family B12-binding radical SAM protein [unclassified Oceanispirochaeta]|uniref:TIGR03960 family B12-binding radical SAM protein n=1 Tax=unclassified Oceanispirochaeta TaxID=2635722 RepID=UPI000E09A161|nr:MULTISPECIES: TIGR03960 family B12-binding radical SAM protein [unclassified Oceanispirochaeta]MBF9016086.1 TIGR03960 family B12-binding radical SAM protein [Oceanispirochaeta sp. M2]NPD72549.1 TIGR03960 family B12-binding radical SAM protein [Oceanispirochaeta sp. M1]RDG32006.1 TIGR03960 family B12-binding radical SAM protein [Oceanispirochaeta sp. M1]
MSNIIAYKDLGRELLQVSKPARYTGGELGSIQYRTPEPLKMAISFPDMYEIGMSNQAIRILYNRYNAVNGIQCERVFAPAQDFEEVLRNKNIPLFTLETGIPLSELHILAFSIGYELTLTNLLNILDLGQIPLHRKDRGPEHPIIVAGGPAATNPAAFSDFVDYVYIGEGEHFINNYAEELAETAVKGGSKEDLEAVIRKDSAYWWPDKKEKTVRALYNEFGQGSEPRSNLPIASLATVQEHGVIEIMRGCPNGCRFCHAGYFYRPFRQKDVNHILKEAEHLVSNCGFRNITLSSLSSGDYVGLLPLVEHLNTLYQSRNISFQLPSLRVNSLNLGLLSELSTVRKSSLTFAVETPESAGQKGLNKDVSRDRILSLLKEAKSKGWKLAKFYFMLGLPVDTGGVSESQAIVDFMLELQKESGMKFNINAGIFIPKPHTPYERVKQFNDQEGMNEIINLRDGLRGKNIKVGFHSPYSSFIEGILCRGDSRAGAILESAFKKGARFDAWDEYHDRSLWQEVISECDWDVEKEICREKGEGEPLPWDSVSLRVSTGFLSKENSKSQACEMTEPCKDDCENPCGVCNKNLTVRTPEPFEFPEIAPVVETEKLESHDLGEHSVKAVFGFSKKDQAIFLGHLDTLRVFERAFQCSGIEINFTHGYNPKPRMEFAHPLSLGVYGTEEIMGVEMPKKPEMVIEDLIKLLNSNLPEGFSFETVKYYPLQQDKNRKKRTLMGLYAGSEYTLQPADKSLLAESTIELFKEKAEELGVGGDYIFTLEEDHIHVKAVFANKKMNNIIKFLKEFREEEPLNEWIITRKKLLALNIKNKISDYFSFDSSQS